MGGLVDENESATAWYVEDAGGRDLRRFEELAGSNFLGDGLFRGDLLGVSCVRVIGDV
jgi:hypothetical protein